MQFTNVWGESVFMIRLKTIYTLTSINYIGKGIFAQRIHFKLIT